MKDIALILPPQEWSFSQKPNFVEIKNKNYYAPRFVEADIIIDINASQADISKIVITDPQGNRTTIRGTANKEEAAGDKFYISDENEITAENIRQCLRSIKWIDKDFEITTLWNTKPNAIKIKSKGDGSYYNIDIEADPGVYSIDWITRDSFSFDSILYNSRSADIELEICDTPASPPYITLRKTYAGHPIWFDLNKVFSHLAKYEYPYRIGWNDAKTYQKYYYRAYKRNAENVLFNASVNLKVIFGDSDIGPGKYLFHPEVSPQVKLLSNKPASCCLADQCEFVNLAMYDSIESDALISVRCRVSTQSLKYIDTVVLHEEQVGNMSIVNTCRIDLSPITEQYPDAGVLQIELVAAIDGRSTEIATAEPLYLLPRCLHNDNYFVFLNALGGWDAWTADAQITSTVKTDISSYIPAQTPDRQQEAELVQNSVLTEQFTLQTKPLDNAARIWLKELASSKAVYDKYGNIVIIDEMNINIASAPEPITIKYHLANS